jgi:hypothetical protein
MNCCSPIGLLLRQGSDYAENSGDNVPHNAKEFNESDK